MSREVKQSEPVERNVNVFPVEQFEIWFDQFARAASTHKKYETLEEITKILWQSFETASPVKTIPVPAKEIEKLREQIAELRRQIEKAHAITRASIIDEIKRSPLRFAALVSGIMLIAFFIFYSHLLYFWFGFC